jgi:signal transduction histidine kinase
LDIAARLEAVTRVDAPSPGVDARRLALLSEIGRAATGAVDRLAFLPVVARTIVDMMSADACEIWLNEDGPVLAATFRDPEAEVRGSPDRLALSAALAGDPLLTGNWFCMPIPGDPDASGVLAVCRAGAWPPEDVSLLESTASMLDLGMEVASAGRLDDRARDEFLALIGHDLRSPLSMVRVGAQLASRNLDAGDLESVQQALKIIEAQSSRLVARLEALLDAVAADGRLLMRLESLDMGDFARSMIEPFQLAAAESESGTRFSVEVAPGTPQARGDRIQLGQVLEHLLDNASKYAAGGHVTVKIEPSGNNLNIHVCDDGPGIAPEDVERVFAPFGRGRSSAGKEGYGLGLYLARNIAAAHGGRLWISRTSRSGTCMTLAIPVASEDES